MELQCQPTQNPASLRSFAVKLNGVMICVCVCDALTLTAITLRESEKKLKLRVEFILLLQ